MLLLLSPVGYNLMILEPCRSGLTTIFAKDVGPLKASRVRIPPVPQREKRAEETKKSPGRLL